MEANYIEMYRAFNATLGMTLGLIFCGGVVFLLVLFWDLFKYILSSKEWFRDFLNWRDYH